MLALQRRALLAAAAVALASTGLWPATDAHADGRESGQWVATWAAAPQKPEPPNVPAVPASFENRTLRQIAHVSLGGSTVRVRFSNEFGSAPLVIGAAHVGLQLAGGGASIVPGTDRVLTFSGRPSVSIPPGAPMLSDPVDLDVPALANLSISIHLPNPTPADTLHALGTQDTYVSAAGDYTGAVTLPTAQVTQSWFFLTGVSVVAPRRAATIVAFGDSITDGYASTVNANRRWPNLLAQRLQATRATRQLAVADAGISGNRTLHDFIGPNALARFDRDVLAVPGAQFVIVLEGINNIGFPGAFGTVTQVDSAADIIASYRQMIARAHEHGLRIYGGTLTPFEGTIFPGYYSAEGEAKRQAVNAWVRGSGEFDAVIDFDRVIRDPARPARMLPAFDSGDHLHPNDAGYQAMADAIDARLFRERDGN